MSETPRSEGAISAVASSSAALADVGLPAPVRELTSVPVDEWAVRRMWEGVQRQREARHGLGERKQRLASAALALLASAVLAALVLLGARHPPLEVAGKEVASQRLGGPLLTKEARRFERVEAPSDGVPARVELADGSSIEALPGARVDGLASGSSEFLVLVRRGRARFAVTPGGPRRWSIETRDARVEVVGTVLSVEADGSGSSVAVEVGTVVVRSPALADGVQRLEAGQSLRLPALAPAAATIPAAPPPAAPATPEPDVAVTAPASASAGATLRRAGPVLARPRAAELWEEVDAARKDNRPARAAALLGRLLREHPDDSQAALAAFTLGVLQLDQLEQPEQAARSFEQALDLGLGAALREDCYARWARAAMRMGDRAAARAVLGEYVRHHPRGRHRASIEAWVGSGGTSQRSRVDQ
jgi:transmembrane sensor